MKIGYIARWWPECAGSYQYDLFAISALSKASQEVDLLVFYSDTRLPKDLAHLTPGVRFIKLVDWFSSRIIRGIARRTLFRLAGVEPIIFRSPQVINHNLDVCIGTAPFIDGIFANCANVLIVHDLWFLRFLPADLLLSNENWRALRCQVGIFNADVIVAESPLGMQDVIDYAHVGKDRVSSPATRGTICSKIYQREAARAYKDL